MKLLSTLFIVGLMIAACTPRPEPADTIPRGTGGLGELTGIVRVVGSAPVNQQVVLETAPGQRTRLVGQLRDELSQLAGLEISVSGRAAPSTDPLADAEIDVATYEIGMVDGRGVILGEIVQVEGREAQLRTAEGDVIYLSGIPNEFRAGQKVWVQGPATVVVQSFGVLRQ